LLKIYQKEEIIHVINRYLIDTKDHNFLYSFDRFLNNYEDLKFALAEDEHKKEPEIIKYEHIHQERIEF
jgi:hypothetical protein